MKKLMILALPLAAASLVAGGPAQAATAQFTIQTGSSSPYGVTALAFKAACSPEVAGNAQLNGLDGKIVDATGFAGRPTLATWTATNEALGDLHGTMYAYDGVCKETSVFGTRQGESYVFPVPGNARWIVVQANKSVQLNVTLQSL